MLKPVTVWLECQNGDSVFIGDFDSVSDAESFIAMLHRIPALTVSVENGDYSIHAPEELINPRKDTNESA